LKVVVFRTSRELNPARYMRPFAGSYTVDEGGEFRGKEKGMQIDLSPAPVVALKRYMWCPDETPPGQPAPE
jgi:hypothetical protein